MTRRTIPTWSRSLANARRRAGLTQEEAAGSLGVSTRTYIRWELGQSLPPPQTESREGILSRVERLAEVDEAAALRNNAYLLAPGARALSEEEIAQRQLEQARLMRNVLIEEQYSYDQLRNACILGEEKPK